MTLIADTGPLVALFDRGDAHHDWALDADFKIYRRLARRVISLFDWPR